MDTPQERVTTSEVPRPMPEKPRRPADMGSPLRVYKPGQGVYVRWGTAAFTGLIALAASYFISEQLPVFSDSQAVLKGGPLVVLAVLALLIFYFCGRHVGVVDFMIATEGEMKKVNWSSRREVGGATKVVIFTMMALGLLLFAVDIGFILLFSVLGVLRVDVLKAMFGGGQ